MNQKKRLYIEAESQSESEHEYRRSQRQVREIMGYLEGTQEVFNTALFDSMYTPQEAWEAVKTHDELYCSTSLVPQMGSMGSPMLFNNLMHLAIQEKVEGKNLFILNQYKSIWWDQLREKLVKGTFLELKNQLFTLSDDGEEFVQVDIRQLLNEIA